MGECKVEILDPNSASVMELKFVLKVHKVEKHDGMTKRRVAKGELRGEEKSRTTINTIDDDGWRVLLIFSFDISNSRSAKLLSRPETKVQRVET